MHATYRISIAAPLLFLACTGCTVPVSEHPLVDPADASMFLELHGVFRSDDDADIFGDYAHVGSAGNGFPAGFVRIIAIKQPKDTTHALRSTTYVGFVERIGQAFILHIPGPKSGKLDDQHKVWDKKWDPDQLAGYIFMRLSLRDGGVDMSALNVEFIKKQIEGQKLAGRVEVEQSKSDGNEVIKSITITAETDELRAFFERHIDGELFDEPHSRYTRVE
jgi:hypothetical protein